MTPVAAVEARRMSFGSAPVNLGALVWEPAGPSTGTPVVLLHCMGANAASWQPVAQALAVDRCVYALDRRGHGSSACPAPEDETLRFGTFRADVLTMLDGLGVENVIGVGHSAGATDLLLAATGTDVFERLILMEPTVLGPTQAAGEAPTLSVLSEAMIARIKRRPDRFSSADAARAFLMAHSALELSTWHPAALEGYFRDALRIDPNDEAAEVVCNARAEAQMLRSILEVSEGIYGGDEFGSIGSVSCPVDLVVCDRSSSTFQMMCASASRVLRTSRVHRQSDASHFLPQADPVRFTDLVLDLITGTPAPHPHRHYCVPIQPEGTPV